MQALLRERPVRVRVSVLVGVCFLLGSAGWLAWLYQICRFAEPAKVDFYTMVLGYLAQIAGIGAYMLACRRLDGEYVAASTSFSLGVYVVLLAPATMSTSLARTLVFGIAMNVVCGYFQGHYLTCLSRLVERERRGLVLGAGCAASTLGSWLLSAVGGGVLSRGMPNVGVCLFLAMIGGFCVHALNREFVDAVPAFSRMNEVAPLLSRSNIVLAAMAVLMASLVKNAGFSFPAQDLSGSVDLELSRLFYGVGLLAAGLLADRSRTYILTACGASLATPFLMLALSGADAPRVALWALGYLLFGFFTVWRIVLFADLAAVNNNTWYAGTGLAVGRVGDVLGTALCLGLASFPMALIATSSALFVAATALLVVLHTRVYVAFASGRARAAGDLTSAEADAASGDAASGDAASGDAASGDELQSIADGALAGGDALVADKRDRMAAFSNRYELSNREQEVLALVLRRKTNAAIAEELFVSEATVKFHVRNILKKTGCSNRREVAELFAGDND